MTNTKTDLTVRQLALLMKNNAPRLAASDHKTRINALEAVKSALIEKQAEIFAANKADVDKAKNNGVSDSIIKRLVFDEEKLSGVVSGIDTLIDLADPIGDISLRRQLSDDLILERISVPIGVIGVIFEARPDALVQISTLCIKSGNMCILKGGKETANTNETLFKVIYEAAIGAGLVEHCLAKVEQHSEIDELLTCHGLVDLLIPRGSNDFVKHIMDNTSIPVLGHADGICHIYVDASADVDLAVKVCLDAKIQYSAACNATETLLVNRDIAENFLPAMKAVFDDAGVKVRGTAEASGISGVCGIELIADDDFKNEYLNFTIAVKLVDNVKEAVEHINAFGSHHTDAIITEDDKSWEYFAAMVDSAGVYRNASTRFADGFRYGFGAEVGISTSKIHARGPVGLFGLMTYKYLLTGAGHTVGEFASGKREFKFKDLS